jgi:hypothetical protein
VESAVIKKIEVLANIAVIVTSIVVCAVLVRRYIFPVPTPETATAKAAPVSTNEGSPRKRSIEPGTKISIGGLDWSKSSRTLVLALSTTCHFCAESSPFYQRLQQQKRSDVHLVALLPQPLGDSQAYLKKLGVIVDEVLQSPLSAVGASGTPTLILVDNQGAVIDSWVGKLSETSAEHVMSLVTK